MTCTMKLISTTAIVAVSAMLSGVLLFNYRPTIEITGANFYVRLSDVVVVSLPLVLAGVFVAVLVARFRSRHGRSN